MPYTVVIADDVTGANDIGIMYAGAGLDTYVYSFCDGREQDYRQCDVLVVDTDSPVSYTHLTLPTMATV